MTAPSKTPMSMSMFATQADYWKARTDQLEIALAESRAECERLRTQSDSLNTLNLGQIKIIAKLQSDLREAESREREAYERAAKVASEKISEYSGNDACAVYVANILRSLSGERREG